MFLPIFMLVLNWRIKLFKIKCNFFIFFCYIYIRATKG